MLLAQLTALISWAELASSCSKHQERQRIQRLQGRSHPRKKMHRGGLQGMEMEVLSGNPFKNCRPLLQAISPFACCFSLSWRFHVNDREQCSKPYTCYSGCMVVILKNTIKMYSTTIYYPKITQM